jgi:N-acetyl sugar amidotransferase
MSIYQICSRCIMDTSIPDITFDQNGVCNFCRLYDDAVRKYIHYDIGGKKRLEALISDMKKKGAKKEYDCIIGVSGGVDSTFVAYVVKKRFGLRPLAVHLDNGWDSELSVYNIEQTLKILNVDLYTYVLDWEEFKDLQISFLKSSIANAEIPTDHAITAILYRIAAKEGISYIITGQNIVTEAIMPASWMYGSTDLRLIKSIHRQFGKTKLKTYPQLGLLTMAYYTMVKGIRAIRILDYIPFNKADAKRLIIDELGWRDYGGKHFESIYTRFFQSFYLMNKYKIDKRKPHLSNLVLSGQMTRDEALAEIMKPPCPPDQMENDVEYVIKKLDLTEREFSEILSASQKSFRDYPNLNFVRRDFGFLVEFLRRLHYRGEN